MDKYKVKISPRAIRELDSIYKYLASEKMVPEMLRDSLAELKRPF